MTDKELRKLNRQELLEILVEQSKKIAQLEEELSKARTELESREISLQEAGSIAEASLRINKVFEAAQQAADQYLANVRRLSEAEK